MIEIIMRLLDLLKKIPTIFVLLSTLLVWGTYGGTRYISDLEARIIEAETIKADLREINNKLDAILQQEAFIRAHIETMLDRHRVEDQKGARGGNNGPTGLQKKGRTEK